MKIVKVLICIIFLTFTIKNFSQTTANVLTPKGSTVTAYIMPENTDENRAYFDSYFKSRYPNARPIDTYPSQGNSSVYYSSTRKFNCHGFAWHMSSSAGTDISDPRWIGKDAGNTDEYIYWNDGSYIQVSSEVYPGKVSWDPAQGGDHSAITTSIAGTVISKWNEYPLMEHQWDDCPFTTSQTILKYYQLWYLVMPPNCNTTNISNKTYTTNTTISNCQINVTNSSVTNNSTVVFDGGYKVTINGPFSVQSGSSLTIK